MNFPVAISPTTTSFAAARKSPGSGCSRASERKTNFAIAMSAAASMPCPVTSPSTTASRPSGERHVVVEVTADIDACRGRVHLADVEAFDCRANLRQERALHRVREVLLLLVEPRVVDRERGLAGDRDGGRDRRLVDRVVGTHRKQRQRAEHLGGRRDRDHRGSRAFLEERHEECVRPTELVRRRNVDLDRVAVAEETLDARAGERLRTEEHRSHGCEQTILRHVQRERQAAARGVDPACAAPRRRPRGARRPSGRPLRASRRARGSARTSARSRRAPRAGAPRPAPTRVPAPARLRGGLPPRAAGRSGPRPRGGRRSPRAARARRRSAPCAPPDRRRADRSARHRPRAAARSRSRFPLPRARPRRPRGGAPSTCRRSRRRRARDTAPSASSSRRLRGAKVRAGEPTRRCRS